MGTFLSPGARKAGNIEDRRTSTPQQAGLQQRLDSIYNKGGDDDEPRPSNKKQKPYDARSWKRAAEVLYGPGAK